MARYNDLSPDFRRWTNAKLMREARSVANLARFGDFFRDAPVTFGTQEDVGDFIRDTTRLYRASWLDPILDEIERRSVKPKKETN